MPDALETPYIFIGIDFIPMPPIGGMFFGMFEIAVDHLLLDWLLLHRVHRERGGQEWEMTIGRAAGGR